MRIWIGFGLVIFLVGIAGCKSEEKAAEGGGEKPAAGEAEKKEGLPEETEVLVLSKTSEIPAKITVPKGSTTFNDSPTKVRIDYGKMGEHFGVQVNEGNEVNTNLKETAAGLAENKYGNTNTILEQTDDLLVYTMKREGEDPNHKFTMLTKLGDTTWVCQEGNYGGWTQEQIDRQMAACKTLTAAE